MARNVPAARWSRLGGSGAAGILAAQHTQFVSPELLVWTVSGEVLIVVILGGLGTLAGPIAGAALRRKLAPSMIRRR